MVRAIYRLGLLDATPEAEHDGHWTSSALRALLKAPDLSDWYRAGRGTGYQARVFRPRMIWIGSQQCHNLDPSVRTAHRVN
jgi:hypothetical protein